MVVLTFTTGESPIATIRLFATMQLEGVDDDCKRVKQERRGQHGKSLAIRASFPSLTQSIIDQISGGSP